MPFILRGVSLLGIDSANAPMPLRRARSGSASRRDMKPRHLKDMATTDRRSTDLPTVFDEFIKAQITRPDRGGDRG